jgi:hypothetical protein
VTEKQTAIEDRFYKCPYAASQTDRYLQASHFRISEKFLRYAARRQIFRVYHIEPASGEQQPRKPNART